MLVAFLGTHVPLIALVLYLLIVSPGGLPAHLGVLATLVAATLVGFVATAWALRGMLGPIRLTSRALRGYLDDGRLPELPIGFGNEAGRLMADVRYAIDSLDSTVRSLEGLSGTDHLTASSTAAKAKSASPRTPRGRGAGRGCSRWASRTSTGSRPSTTLMATRRGTPASGTWRGSSGATSGEAIG